LLRLTTTPVGDDDDADAADEREQGTMMAGQETEEDRLRKAQGER
jgi:hypothetical protein